MTHEEFELTIATRIEVIRETLQTKGQKYSRGSDDRLSNFKNCVSGVTPLQVWEVFFRKHLSAIEFFLKTGLNTGEDIRDTHIHDCIAYLLILECLIKEQHTEFQDCISYLISKERA